MYNRNLRKPSPNKNFYKFVNYLADPSTTIWESFHIIIGRRKTLSKEGRRRKATYTTKRDVEVISYDRILDMVKERYHDPRLWK